MDFDWGRVARRGPVQSLSINSPESSSDGICNRSCLPVCLRFPARRAVTVVYAVRGELGEQMSFEPPWVHGAVSVSLWPGTCGICP